MIGLACLASLGIKLGRVPQPFVDSHAWVSAHFSIMARNYANRRIYRVPCDLESVTRIHTGIDGRDGHFHVIFATWADRAGLLRVCPGLVDVLGRRYQSREVGLVRIFDLEQPLPGGAGR